MLKLVLLSFCTLWDGKDTTQYYCNAGRQDTGHRQRGMCKEGLGEGDRWQHHDRGPYPVKGIYPPYLRKNVLRVPATWYSSTIFMQL